MVKQQNMDFQFIYLKNISFSYPKEEKKLFENFNLSIKEKDFLSIIGPNGSGKTTIFKLIIKEYMPDEGLIYLKSKELKNWKRKEVAKFVSYLPQKIPLDINFNVIDYVVMGRYPYKEIFEDYNSKDYEIALDYLEKLDIKGIKDKNFSNLSGGEQRRVMLAQALVSESNVLLLDEPDSFLDIAHKKEFYEILEFLNKEEGKTIVVISHDLQLAFSYSKRICGIKDGKLWFIDEIENIDDNLISELFNTKIKTYRFDGKTGLLY